MEGTASTRKMLDEATKSEEEVGLMKQIYRKVEECAAKFELEAADTLQQLNEARKSLE